MKRGGQETLQQKMDRLDTLSAGIVYGREDAWDKLQARMEQKPPRKIAWRYWTIAAAILLLLVCVGIFHKTPQQQVVVNSYAAKEQAPVKQEVPAVTEQPVQVVRSEAAPHKNISHKPAPLNTQPVKEPEAVIVAHDPVPIPVATQEIASPVPAVTVKQPMKVYHINELERGTTPAQPPAVAAADGHTDLRSLPVLHISDVIHQDEVLRDIRKANRASWGKRLFSRPDPFYRDIPQETVTEEYYTETRNPFKAIRNIQN